MAAGNALTRKLGPLPVWAWAVVVLGAWFLFFRTHAAAATTPVPVSRNTSGADSGAQPPASGQGSPADNMNSDLLNALLTNQKTSYNSLLTALQTMSAGGASGFGPGYGAAPAAAAPAVAAANGAPPSAASPLGVAAAPSISSPYTPVELTLPPGIFSLDPGPNIYTPVATGVENPSAALAGATVPWNASYAPTTTAGTRALAGVGPGRTSIVDPSGHVVNASGARVGGVSAE